MTAIAVERPLAHDATVRRATSADVHRMARAYVRSQEKVGSAADRHGITHDAVSRWMRKALLTSDIWLLEREYGEVAGVVAMTRHELEVLDVDPDLRRRGYGARLMELAKQQRPGGLVARVGSRRLSARDFLLHHGFEPAGPADRGGVETLVWGARRSRWQRTETVQRP